MTLDHLKGRRLSALQFDENSQEWLFSFSEGVHLNVAAPWRVVTFAAVVLGWRDHGQSFGLGHPVVAALRIRELLGDAQVIAAIVAAHTADLRLEFAGGQALEVFNDS